MEMEIFTEEHGEMVSTMDRENISGKTNMARRIFPKYIYLQFNPNKEEGIQNVV